MLSELIYDRTLDDVKEAKQIRSDIIQQSEVLTEIQITTLERGMITTNTINRIARAQKELSDRINGLGYFNTPIDIIEYTGSDIFTDKDLERLVSNNAILRKAFFVFKNSPKNAIAKYHYAEFNALERILSDLFTMAEFVSNNYRQAGTFESGE